MRDEYEITEKFLNEEFKYVPRKEKTPEGINEKITMLGFQLESLAWMTEQEESPVWRGGILADDMGMGKTLQAIALILHNAHNKAQHGSIPKTTLVICPVVALNQWENEIKKYTKPDTLDVCIYHGSDRPTDVDEVLQHDLVITSYSIVESEYRMENVGYKRKGERVKKPSLLHGINWFRVVLDEAHSIKDRTCSTARY